MKKLLMVIAVMLAVFALSGFAMAATLVWDAPTGGSVPDGYVVFFKDVATGTIYSKTVTGATQVDMALLNVAPGKAYDYYVTAYNVAGMSGPSNIVTDTRPAYVPPADSLPPTTVNVPPGAPITIRVQ